MGSIYRRKEIVRDERTGEPIIDSRTGKPKREEIGPWWIKYYRDGRPFRESTGTLEKTEARRKLKQREGEVAEGRFRGVRMDRTRFDELADDLKAQYRIAARESDRRANSAPSEDEEGRVGAVQRLEEALAHLLLVFRGYRAVEITSEKVTRYIQRRKEQGAAGGTINRELGMVRAMFRHGMKQTPPKVAQVPHIPRLKEGKRSGFFEHEDFLALRGALPDYTQVPVTLAYYSGMRMGEVFSLTWEQLHLREGRLYLKPQDTKTREPRVLYLTSDLYRVLEAWKQRTDTSWPGCPWICHRNGERLTSIRTAWQKGCQAVGLGQLITDTSKTWKKRTKKRWHGKVPHDFRRTAIRNMVRAGIPEKVAMLISGHRTRSVFNRYNIVNEADLKAAAQQLSSYFSEQMGTISGTVSELQQAKPSAAQTEVLGTAEKKVERETGFEPATLALARRCSTTE